MRSMRPWITTALTFLVWSAHTMCAAQDTGTSSSILIHDTTGKTYLIDGPDFLKREFLPERLFPMWAPDQSRMLYAQNGHIYLAAADGSGSVDVAAGGDPSWSPDGSRMAYCRDDTIWVANVSGGGETPVALGTEPYWTPDGTQILFATWERNPGYNYELNVVHPDGTGMERVLDLGHIDTFPLSPFSPTGNQFLYEPCGDQSHCVYLMDLDTREVRFMGRSGETPCWSPDGSRIAYVVFASGYEPTPVGLYVVPASGTQEDSELILAGDQCWSPHRPRWSPDGGRIAFTVESTCDDTPKRVYIINADGTDLTEATEGEAVGWYPGRPWEPIPTAVERTSWGRVKRNADAEKSQE